MRRPSAVKGNRGPQGDDRPTNQQILQQFNIAVVILQGPTNRLKDLHLLVPTLLATLPEVQKGEVRWVSR